MIGWCSNFSLPFRRNQDLLVEYPYPQVNSLCIWPLQQFTSYLPLECQIAVVVTPREPLSPTQSGRPVQRFSGQQWFSTGVPHSGPHQCHPRGSLAFNPWQLSSTTHASPPKWYERNGQCKVISLWIFVNFFIKKFIHGRTKRVLLYAVTFSSQIFHEYVI